MTLGRDPGSSDSKPVLSVSRLATASAPTVSRPTAERTQTGRWICQSTRRSSARRSGEGTVGRADEESASELAGALLTSARPAGGSAQ
jgi:hypothetical protein